MKRIIIAFLIAPLAPVIFYSLLTNSNLFGIIFSIPWDFLLIGMFTYPIALVFGIPTYILFLRKGWRSMKSYALGGAIIGFSFFIVSLFFLGVTKNWKGVIIPIFFCSISGAISASVFHLIAKPDRKS